MLEGFLLALVGLFVIWLSPLWILDLVGIVVVLFGIVICLAAATGRRV